MTRLVAVLAVLLATLTGCTNPREMSETQAADLLKKDLLSEETVGAGVQFSDAEADCISAGWVKKFGVDGLFDVGLLTTRQSDEPQYIATEAAKKAVAVMAGCSDLVKITMAGQFAKKDPPVVKQCVRKVFDEPMVRRVWVDALDGLSTTEQRLKRRVKACVKKELRG